MRIAVLGATGVVGRNVVPRLVEEGYEVRAGVHGDAAAPRATRVTNVALDILDAASVTRFVAGCDAVINVASAIPRPDGSSGDWATYDRIRREGTAHLLDACTRAGAVLIQQSVAMLHAADTTRPQREDDPLTGDGVLAAGLALERTVAGWQGDWRIVRGGHLYGPGTGTDARWIDTLAARAAALPGDGSDWVSPVHVADLAAAFVTVLRRGAPRAAWIAADDRPLRWRELFDQVRALLPEPAAAPVEGGERRLPSFRVGNAALRRLGWTPRFATIASGLVASVDEWRRRPGA